MAAKKLTPELAADLVKTAAPALSVIEACFISRALSGDKLKDAIDSLVADGTEGAVDVTVRFQGHLARGEAGDKKATSRALRKATLALLVRRMGLQREAALDLLAEVLIEAQKLGEDAETKLLAEHPEIEEAFGRVDEMVDQLPRIPVAGRVTLSNVRVDKVEE